MNINGSKKRGVGVGGGEGMVGMVLTNGDRCAGQLRISNKLIRCVCI